jgi:hypothetical protein
MAFFVFGLVIGLLVGEATLVFFSALIRQGEDPNFRSINTGSARTRRLRAEREQVLPLRDEAEDKAVAA